MDKIQLNEYIESVMRQLKRPNGLIITTGLTGSENYCSLRFLWKFIPRAIKSSLWKNLLNKLRELCKRKLKTSTLLPPV